MKFEVVEEAVVNLLSRGQRLYHPTVSAGDGREKKRGTGEYSRRARGFFPRSFTSRHGRRVSAHGLVERIGREIRRIRRAAASRGPGIEPRMRASGE